MEAVRTLPSTGAIVAWLPSCSHKSLSSQAGQAAACGLAAACRMLSASEPEIESYLWSQAVPRLQFRNSKNNRSTRAAIQSVIVARRNDSPRAPSALVAATLVNGTSLVRMGFCANWCPGLMLGFERLLDQGQYATTAKRNLSSEAGKFQLPDIPGALEKFSSFNHSYRLANEAF